MKKTYLIIPTLAILLVACNQEKKTSEENQTKQSEKIQESSEKIEDFSDKSIEEIDEIIDSVDAKIKEEQTNINKLLKTI